MRTYKPKSETLRFRVHQKQKQAYKRAAAGNHLSKWAIAHLDEAAKEKAK